MPHAMRSSREISTECCALLQTPVTAQHDLRAAGKNFIGVHILN